MQFMNHPQLSLLIPEEQQHCLQYMQNLLIEEFEDIKNGYKIILKFLMSIFWIKLYLS